MLLTKSLVVLLLTTTLLLATEADARRRHRLKRQHDDQGDDHDSSREAHRARRRHLRRRRGRGEDGASHQNPNVTLVTPVRLHAPEMEGIPVGEAVPQHRCPPPVKPFFSELCAASACLDHHHCPPSTSCCFNGCVHTCLSQVVSPAVIDWLEDSSVLLPILEESSPAASLPIRYEESNLAFAEGGAEAIHLPGGCTITGTQYSQLQDFMKAPSIDDCKCNQGEVVCAVKLFQS